MTRAPLPHDFGPMWREHNRRQQLPFVDRLGSRFALVCIIALCVIATVIISTHSALAFDYPPEEYTHEPEMEVVINRQPLGETIRACEYLTGVQTRWACQTFVGDTCVIYLPERGAAVTWASLQILTEHEKAHCNGWTHPVRGNTLYPSRTSVVAHTEDRE